MAKVMLLVASGKWHRPLPNEPLVPPGWEEVFRLIAGEALGCLPDAHCSIMLTYKPVRFEDFATNGMLEAAARFDLERCVELAMEKLANAPDDIVEIDALPQQVAAAVVLSRHKIVKALVQNDQVTFSRRLRLSPLEILRELYSWSEVVELRLTVGPAVWKTVKAAVRLQGLTPEDALTVLTGNEAKRAELLNLLKVRANTA